MPRRPRLTRDLDEAVCKFQQARLNDGDAYWFLNGVSLRVRRPAGCKRAKPSLVHPQHEAVSAKYPFFSASRFLYQVGGNLSAQWTDCGTASRHFPQKFLTVRTVIHSYYRDYHRSSSWSSARLLRWVAKGDIHADEKGAAGCGLLCGRIFHMPTPLWPGYGKLFGDGYGQDGIGDRGR